MSAAAPPAAATAGPAPRAAPFPPGLRADLEAALAARFGGPVRAHPMEALSSRISHVWRVALSGPAGAPATVVVKHLAAPWYGAPAGEEVPRDFLEEAAAYAFLEELADPPFCDRALRLAWIPGGALVLEDLGPGDRTVPLGRVGDLLAVSFARLHAATAGRCAEHRAARLRMGIDPDGPDARYDGVDAAARRFARGTMALAGWCEALAVAPAAEVAALLEAVETAVLRPGPFHTLVHDDLASGRQCVVRCGRLLLLDWENAKYAHALRDLAKVLTGKFERYLETGEMFRACPEMEPALAARYRRELARAGGPDVDDAAWGEALGAAVLYNTVVQVGALVGLHAVSTVVGEVLPNLRGLLFRMGEVLHSLPGWEDPRRILLNLGGRIA
ncbi:MAG TPA: hypothetical protein VHG28_20120 [Longimicrobiaceae bacterium]|nr:hypothetical protein [Longimicrobiaceae bacterium]